MFHDIGKKLKTIAEIVTVAGSPLFIFAGLAYMAMGEDVAFIGLSIALGGTLCCVIGGFMIYGFGQLIENTDVLAAEAKNRAEKE